MDPTANVAFLLDEHVAPWMSYQANIRRSVQQHCVLLNMECVRVCVCACLPAGLFGIV